MRRSAVRIRSLAPEICRPFGSPGGLFACVRAPGLRRCAAPSLAAPACSLSLRGCASRAASLLATVHAPRVGVRLPRRAAPCVGVLPSRRGASFAPPPPAAQAPFAQAPPRVSGLRDVSRETFESGLRKLWNLRLWTASGAASRRMRGRRNGPPLVRCALAACVYAVPRGCARAAWARAVRTGAACKRARRPEARVRAASRAEDGIAAPSGVVAVRAIRRGGAFRVKHSPVSCGDAKCRAERLRTPSCVACRRRCGNARRGTAARNPAPSG